MTKSQKKFLTENSDLDLCLMKIYMYSHKILGMFLVCSRYVSCMTYVTLEHRLAT